MQCSSQNDPSYVEAWVNLKSRTSQNDRAKVLL